MSSADTSNRSGNTSHDERRGASGAQPRATRAAGRAPVELRQSTVLLVHPRDGQGDMVLRDVRRVGCRVEMVWPVPMLAPIGFDFAMVAIDAAVLAAAPWLSGVPSVPVIALVDGERGLSAETIRLSNAHAALMKPCHPEAVLTNLALARNIFSYERRLLGKINKLEESLHASRQIEQAKQILMQQRKIKANEAYDYLRRQAMSKQMSVSAISAALVDAHGLME